MRRDEPAALRRYSRGAMTPRSVDELLADARRRLERLDPQKAHEALSRGAVLVDIRSESQRGRDGVVPGAHLVARNVLEWRADPASEWRGPAPPPPPPPGPLELRPG